MSQRILIAEDDELQGAVLLAALERRGYHVHVVTDGLEAVRHLRTGRYDLGLLDHAMPEVSGLAVARILHEFLSEAECPRLIAVTAATETVQQRLALEGQAFDAVVSKRLGLPALLSVIDTHLASVAHGKARALSHRQATSAARYGVRKAHIPASPPSLSSKPAPAAETEKSFLPDSENPARLEYPFAAPPGNDGQVQAISLTAFKTVLGPEWPRIALRVMIKAEHIIKRRLISGDVLSRSGDDGFVVWFNTIDAQRNEAVLAAAVREIRIRLLADFGEEATLSINPSPSAVRQYVPASDAGEQ